MPDSPVRTRAWLEPMVPTPITPIRSGVVVFTACTMISLFPERLTCPNPSLACPGAAGEYYLHQAPNTFCVNALQGKRGSQPASCSPRLCHSPRQSVRLAAGRLFGSVHLTR